MTDPWAFSPFGGPHSAEKLMQSRESGGYGLGDAAMAMRALAVRDPLYLASKVLGLELLGNPGPAHLRVAELMCEQKNYIYLDHRGSFKTTLSDEVGTIFQWLRYHNDRVLFLQASLENGKALAKQVRRHLQANETFRLLFPEYRIDSTSDAGQVLAFSVPCKTVNKREESLEIGTPDANLSGRHYDVLAGSDISNEQTSPPPCGRGSIEEAIKLRNWLATMDGLLESKLVNPRAHKRIDGTRWSEMDIYQYLIDNDVKGSFEKVIYGVEIDKEGRFTSSLPGMTHEMLLEIRERPTMSASLWAANYMNQPIVGEGAFQFLPEWFKPYEKAPELLDIAITVDPAWTEQDKNPEADRSAIVASGVSVSGDLYVLAYRAGRWSPGDLLEHLYAMISTWNPLWVGIEGGTQSVALIETFTNELHRNFPYVPYRTLAPKGKNKLVRAVPLHTHAQRYGIYVKPGEHDELVQELLQFPGGKYKDLVDALSYRAQDMVMPSTLNRSEPRTDNPRGLPTGKDVLDEILKRNRLKKMTPWDAAIASWRN